MGKRAGAADRLVFAGLLAVLVFAPLAFGSVHVWAYSACTLAVLLLVCLKAFQMLLTSGERAAGWVCTPLTLPAVLLAALAALQLTPLPLDWLARISPLAAADQAVVAEVLARAGTTAPGRALAAYHRHAAVVEGLKLLAAFGMWLLVVHTVRSRRRIDALATVLVAAGLFEALYAVWQVFSSEPSVWWWVSRSGRSRFASGTFVVSNHFASYMGMMLPLALGFAMAQRGRAGRLVQGLGGSRAAVQRLVGLFEPEDAALRKLLLWFAALIMGLGLLLSASRGGILSLAAALTLVAGLLILRRGYRLHGLIAVLSCLAMLMGGLTVGIDPTLDKFGQAESGFDLRWQRTRSLAPMMADYPLTGVGLGSWRHLYERYVPEGIGFRNAGHAHNDWFETATELGVAGLVILIVGYGALLATMVRAWRRRRDPYAVGLGAGALAGMLATGLHAFFEFSLHIPANPLTLAAVAGIGYAAVHRRRSGLLERFTYGIRRPPAAPWARAMLMAAILLAAGVALNAAGRHLLAEMHCPTEWNSTLNLDWNPPLADIQEAIAINPANAGYHFKAAEHFMRRPADDDSGRQAINDDAIRHLEAAVRRNPAEARYWFYLGQRYSFRDSDPLAYLDRWLPLADRCFEAAVHCGPANSELLFDVAWYWVWRASILPDRPRSASGAVATRQAGIRRFQTLFRRSLSLSPGRWKKAVSRIREYYPEPAIIMESLPPDNADLNRRALQHLTGIS